MACAFVGRTRKKSKWTQAVLEKAKALLSQAQGLLTLSWSVHQVRAPSVWLDSSHCSQNPFEHIWTSWTHQCWQGPLLMEITWNEITIWFIRCLWRSYEYVGLDNPKSYENLWVWWFADCHRGIHPVQPCSGHLAASSPQASAASWLHQPGRPTHRSFDVFCSAKLASEPAETCHKRKSTAKPSLGEHESRANKLSPGICNLKNMRPKD